KDGPFLTEKDDVQNIIERFDNLDCVFYEGQLAIVIENNYNITSDCDIDTVGWDLDFEMKNYLHPDNLKIILTSNINNDIRKEDIKLFEYKNVDHHLPNLKCMQFDTKKNKPIISNVLRQ